MADRLRPVDIWSSPTTVYTGGLGQLPVALGGRPMILVADARLEQQIALVSRQAELAELVEIDPTADEREWVLSVVQAHPGAAPVALGGGSVMDLVRLVALAATDPAANGLGAVDGVRVLPTIAVNPAVCLPTTVGTASEVSPVAVRATSAGTAMIVSPGLRSRAAVLDPRMTATLSVGALAAGLVEPWARICVPAVAGQRLRTQDGVVRGLAEAILGLGDDLEGLGGDAPDESWRAAAALASVQTHLSLVSIGRQPAGHLLWPPATELMRTHGLSKAAALAPLIPAWLRGLAGGQLGAAWGTPDRVREVIGADPETAANRMTRWLADLGLDPGLPAGTDVGAVVARVLDPWQASGLFLAGVRPDEVAWLVETAG